MDTILELKLSSLYYLDKELLRDVHLKVRNGERILIVGATGAGKSSLLSTLNLMNQSYTGNILFYGKDIREYPPNTLRSKICMVMQEPWLEGNSIAEALKLPLQYHSIRQKEISERDKVISDFFSAFQLSHLNLEIGIEKLSGGEKQRIALIRALQLKPEILLLDEISSALDQTTSGIISDCIFSNYPGTVIAISHDPLWQDRWQRIWSLENGLLIDKGRV